MGDSPSTNDISKDFDLGTMPTIGFDDPWNEPNDQRALTRRQLVRYQAGFLILGLALVVASLIHISWLVSMQLRLIPILQLILSNDFPLGTIIVLGSLAGVSLLWGRWPDESWRRRSGLLLLLCLVDLVSWSAEYAVKLGISEVGFGHDYFRSSLGTAIGWSEFALIASLAAEMATALGETQAVELGKAARSLTTLTALIWMVFFFLRTNWNAPVWPLRPFRMTILTLNLRNCWFLLYAILLVQVTLLCLRASRICGQTVRAMTAEDRANETFLSPSEQGWQKLQGESSQDFDPWEPPGHS